MSTEPRHYQAGRTHRRVSITLSPEAREGLDAIRQHTGLISLSAAIAWAVRAGREEVAREAAAGLIGRSTPV